MSTTEDFNPPIPQLADWAHLVKYGYAPGHYQGKCHSCTNMFHNLDKRATHCRVCATSLWTADQKEEVIELNFDQKFPSINGTVSWNAGNLATTEEAKLFARNLLKICDDLETKQLSNTGKNDA